MILVKMNKRFSILINVYNGAEFISQTLQSAINQTFTNFEILIYDNCSTDCTLNKLNGFDDPRIRLFESDKTIPLPLARQYLLERASGDYCIFLDADDLWLPNFLEMTEKTISKTGNVCFLYSNFCVIDRDNKSLNVKNSIDTVRTVPIGKLLSSYNVGFFCFCFSRCLIMDSGIRFDADINAGCDYAFVLRINARFSGIESPYILGINRWHPGNLSQMDPSKNALELASWHYNELTSSSLGSAYLHIVQGSRYQLYSMLKTKNYHGYCGLWSLVAISITPLLALKKLRRFIGNCFERMYSIFSNVYLYLFFYRIFFLRFDGATFPLNNKHYSCHKVYDLDDITIVNLIYLMTKHSVFNPKDFYGNESFVTLRYADSQIVGAAFFTVNFPLQLSKWLRFFFHIPGFNVDDCVLFSSSCSARKLSSMSDAIERIENKVSLARALGKKSAITISNVDVKNAKFFFERLGFKSVSSRFRRKL